MKRPPPSTIGIAALTALGALAIGGAGGCGAADTDYTVKYAPDFRRNAPTVSVFGVYRDGRMSAEAWNELSPRFASAFGGACEVAYSDALLADDAALASAVDELAREGGVTDALTGLFAPAATGDAIALVSVTGYPSKTPGSGKKGTAQTPMTSGMRGGGASRRGARGVAPSQEHSGESEARDAFEISVSLFSVREHRTVGIVAMKYTGKDIDGSVAGFFQKLRTELPNATCRGWNHDVRIDADRVRALRE